MNIYADAARMQSRGISKDISPHGDPLRFPLHLPCFGPKARMARFEGDTYLSRVSSEEKMEMNLFREDIKAT